MQAHVGGAMQKGRVWFFGLILRAYYGILRLTCRVQLLGADRVFAQWKQGRNVVFACPHGILLPALISFDGFPVAVLTSKSRDGDLINQVLEARGFVVVRGSSSRGGAEALVQLRNHTRTGKSVGMTFDGPRGPALKVKPGVLKCAELVSGSTFFCHVTLNSVLWMRLKSWDRFLLPMPFCSWNMHFIHLENQKDRELMSTEIESLSEQLQGWVYSGNGESRSKKIPDPLKKKGI